MEVLHSKIIVIGVLLNCLLLMLVLNVSPLEHLEQDLEILRIMFVQFVILIINHLLIQTQQIQLWLPHLVGIM